MILLKRSRLKVLVACEFSGIVRDAFISLGHDAFSVDLLPSESDNGVHLQMDICRVLDTCREIDLLIAFPPCTYLCNSGVRWLYGGSGNVRCSARWRKMEQAAKFFKLLLDAPVKYIALENPIMHRFGREIVGRRQDQCVQPWQFGHAEKKATCLWLKNLPALVPSNVLDSRFALPRVHFASPSPERWRVRSRTLQGIAQAMAKQWGSLCSPG